jgi:Ca-activated chloride channel family protein
MGGTVYLQVSVITPTIRVPRQKPKNVSIVLDRSGSMADEGKIRYAKSALLAIADQLSPEDLLSIVIYDDVVEVLRPVRRVKNREEIRRLIEGIEPRGSTNLGGGMIEGFNQTRRFASKEYVNRVILLSDGLANQGITSPAQLQKIARDYRSEHSISLTTMGVGLDYNENLMVGLAEFGGGNYYFIESPHSIAHILHQEFDAMTTILAQNATLEITLGNRVKLSDVIGYQWKEHNGRYQIDLGDLYSNHTQDITLELEVPMGAGRMELARGSLAYTASPSEVTDKPEFITAAEYSADRTAVEQKRDLEVQGKVDVAVSTRQVDRAMESLDNGNAEDALLKLEEAVEELSASPAAGSSAGGAFIKEQESRLGQFRQALKDSAGDQRRAKKAIQYDNYKAQKNNQ